MMTREEKHNETPRKEKMQEALAHYDEIATKACWHRSDIPDAIRAYYTPLPPAEGAEAILHRHIDKQSMDELSVNVWPDILEAMQEFAAPQPTAEGAEEILVKHGFFIMAHKDSNEEVRKAFIEPVLAAMQEFATLHAHKIADKMVSERLREELINYEIWRNGQGDDAAQMIESYLKK